VMPSPTITVDRGEALPSPIAATNTPAPTQSLAPAISAPPTIVKRCPSQPELALSELGLSDSARLIVTAIDNPSRTDFWLIDSQLNTTSSLEHIDGSSVLQISPDQRWAAYTLRVEKEVGYAYDLWVSSIEGDERMKILSSERLLNYLWSDHKTLVVIDREASAPTFRINPFDMEIIPLDPVIIDVGAWQFTFDPSGTKLIYLPADYMRPESWKLYDYSTGEEANVFPGMDVSRIELPPDVSVSWKSTGVSLAFMDEHNLDLANNVPSVALQERPFPTHTISFPDKSIRRHFLWWSSDNRLLAFLRYLELHPGDYTGPAQFFVLDTVEWVLVDYCVDPGSIYASVDERFLAITTHDSNEQYGTLIVEIATGKRAWLEGVRVRGWAESE
jgi:hypothetical protein